jgi:hypothetical protein
MHISKFTSIASCVFIGITALNINTNYIILKEVREIRESTKKIGIQSFLERKYRPQTINDRIEK